jgi:iron complex transport system permease protein
VERPVATVRHGLRYALAVWTSLAAAAVASLLVALAAGSVAIGAGEVLGALAGSARADVADIVLGLRAPRALAAFGVGGLLALAGALMQILLRNPLADPYVLGLSGGAATGAMLALLAGLGGAVATLGAGVGALVSVALVFGLARRDLARAPAPAQADVSPRLLLTGAVLASGWAAAIVLVLTLAPDAALRGMLFWLIGDLNGVASALPSLVTLVLALAFAWPLAADLNVMLRGEAVAESLGVAVGRTRTVVYMMASACTAVAVVTGGAIAFVGLVVPHALRLVIGNDQRVLLPASALAGGTLLVVADTLARTAVAPVQLPVGVLTAVLGVPTFLALLYGRGRR